MAERLKGEDAYDSAIIFIAEGRADTREGAREAIRLLERALLDGIPPELQAKAYYFMGNKYILDDYNYQASYNSYKKALTIRKTLDASNESEEEKKLLWNHAYDMMALVATKIIPDNVDEEIRLYKEVIEFTDHPRAHILIAFEYYDINKKDQARQHFEYIVNNEDKLKIYDKYYEIRKDAIDALNTKELSNKSGCFIATAAMGTPLADEVIILSNFRDEYLSRSLWGRKLTSFYYRVSPPLASLITAKKPLCWLVRHTVIHPIVKLIKK